jgi:predicted nucleic acid-binding protein
LEAIVLDTNILIEILKNNKETVQIVNDFEQELFISSITVMELYYGARNKKELVKLKKFTQLFSVIDLDKNISQISTTLIETYAKSHNLSIPDSLIASTCKVHNLTLFTYNKKDFRYIDDLNLYQV